MVPHRKQATQNADMMRASPDIRSLRLPYPVRRNKLCSIGRVNEVPETGDASGRGMGKPSALRQVAQLLFKLVL